ncbi:MAG TPA: hypothetical protein VJ302_34210 [Blastocatellia bacterium]|nr:hypothetical protein [Blastocatellia bacterium]
MQVNGSNYLIPLGVNIRNEAEGEFKAVDVGFVLAPPLGAH